MLTMLFRCMRAELIKLKRSFIWIVFLILPILSTLMGCFNYLQNIDILTDGWYALWTQATLFYSNFFFPPLIALYCAYLWRLENFNHNRNALMTSPIPISVLYSAQFLAVAVVVLLTQLYVGVLYVISGLAVGIQGLPRLKSFTGFCAAASAGCPSPPCSCFCPPLSGASRFPSPSRFLPEWADWRW